MFKANKNLPTEETKRAAVRREDVENIMVLVNRKRSKNEYYPNIENGRSIQ